MSVLSPARCRRGLASPNRFLWGGTRLYHRRGYTRSYNTDGVDVFAEDWDILIILDACRYDMFAAQSSLPGTLESRISRGSNTVEFLTGNVRDRSLLDTVYVTANPQLYSNREWLDPSFHAIVEVWQGDDWDEERHTVLPETMADRTLDAAERFPNKRLVAHFVQPHYPFLSDDPVFDSEQAFDTPEEGSCWQQVMTGSLSVNPAAVWDAYRETLDRALSAVERLLASLDCKTVVTADHGNMIGERARPIPVHEWGHPQGIYTEELVRVPWLVHENGSRRDVIGEVRSTSKESASDAMVTDRLTQLGYR